MLLSLDLGTTHLKAGLFALDGRLLVAKSHPTETLEMPGMGLVYDPEGVWQAVVGLVHEVLRTLPGPVLAVGITGMAETGLLVGARTGRPRTPLLPWFNRQAAEQLHALLEREPGREHDRFLVTGLWPSYKTSLAKLRWLRQTQPEALPGSLWLSLPDYIALRLTGQAACEPSLAGRSYMFRIAERQWDFDWIQEVGLGEVGFPTVHQSGEPVGEVALTEWEGVGLRRGTPVAIGGHDHICAAYGVQSLANRSLEGPNQDQVFDSLGTAESLTGLLARPESGGPPLGEAEYRSRLSFGCHVAPGAYYWLGGMSASGGSLEWLRSLLGEPRLSYAGLEELAAQAAQSPPSGILYFPYLAGSGSPHTHPGVRAAFIGLDAAHTRAEVVKAVLEGTALELEFIRRTAQDFLGLPIAQLTAAGGSTALAAWMQIKADVSGLPVIVPAVEQAALLGAALLAGKGSGSFGSTPELHQPDRVTYEPDPRWREAYASLYAAFIRLQEPLRSYSAGLPTGYSG